MNNSSNNRTSIQSIHDEFLTPKRIVFPNEINFMRRLHSMVTTLSSGGKIDGNLDYGEIVDSGDSVLKKRGNYVLMFYNLMLVYVENYLQTIPKSDPKYLAISKFHDFVISVLLEPLQQLGTKNPNACISKVCSDQVFDWLGECLYYLGINTMRPDFFAAWEIKDISLRELSQFPITRIYDKAHKEAQESIRRTLDAADAKLKKQREEFARSWEETERKLKENAALYSQFKGEEFTRDMSTISHRQELSRVTEMSSGLRGFLKGNQRDQIHPPVFEESREPERSGRQSPQSLIRGFGYKRDSGESSYIASERSHETRRIPNPVPTTAPKTMAILSGKPWGAIRTSQELPKNMDVGERMRNPANIEEFTTSMHTKGSKTNQK